MNVYVASCCRTLDGIPIIVRLLSHNHEGVRYAAVCLLRNLSYSIKTDEIKVIKERWFACPSYNNLFKAAPYLPSRVT